MANISDKLKKASTSAKTKKASDKPVLSGQEVLVDKVVEMKKALEDMERTYEQLESQLNEKSYSVYDSVRDSNYSSSIFAEGKTSNGCMVVYSDKFSNLPVEMEEELRKKDPKYDDHFIEVRKLAVKRDAGKTISDALIDKLMKALGEDDFFAVFDVKQEIGTKKGMAEKFHELPDEVKDMLKQAKPSVRNVTTDGKVC